jgi:hypothetical protein
VHEKGGGQKKFSWINMSHHWINISQHISFDIMARLIDLIVKTSLYMIKDLSHLYITNFSDCFFTLDENFETYFPNFFRNWTRKLRKTRYEIYVHQKWNFGGWKIKMRCKEKFSQIFMFKKPIFVSVLLGQQTDAHFFCSLFRSLSCTTKL